jgi:Uma2 family endonuclease
MVTRTRMTLTEFRDLPESLERHELIDGELIVSPTPRYPHQNATFNAAKLVERLAPDGTTVIAPMDVYLIGEEVVQPDVFWVSAGSTRCKLGEDGYWYGAPDLVVEVLSPSTAGRDRGVKFELYERAGVREYWLLDPEAEFLEAYTLAEDTFKRLGVYGMEKPFESPLLGQKIEIGGIFKR